MAGSFLPRCQIFLSAPSVLFHTSRDGASGTDFISGQSFSSWLQHVVPMLVSSLRFCQFFGSWFQYHMVWLFVSGQFIGSWLHVILQKFPRPLSPLRERERERESALARAHTHTHTHTHTLHYTTLHYTTLHYTTLTKLKTAGEK